MHISKKILTFICCCTLTCSSYSAEYIHSWSKVVKNNETDLIKLLKENQCTNEKAQLAVFYKKNPNFNELKTGNSFLIQKCYTTKTFTDEELNIIQWKKTSTEKGFILSKELEKNGCGSIFKKQIPHFHKKNNNLPPNVDLFPIGTKVELQQCKKEEQETTNLTKDSSEENLDTPKKESINKMSSFLIGKTISEDSNIMTIGLDLKASNANLKLLNNNESAMIKLKYTHGFNNIIGIYADLGLIFSIKNKNKLRKTITNAGFSLTKDPFKISIGQALFSKGNNISYEIEYNFYENYGVFFEHQNYKSIEEEKTDTNSNFIGFKLYF